MAWKEPGTWWELSLGGAHRIGLCQLVKGLGKTHSILKSRMTPSERRTNIRSQGQSKGTCWEATATMEGGGVQGVSQELWSSWHTGA